MKSVSELMVAHVLYWHHPSSVGHIGLEALNQAVDPIKPHELWPRLSDAPMLLLEQGLMQRVYPVRSESPRHTGADGLITDIMGIYDGETYKLYRALGTQGLSPDFTDRAHAFSDQLLVGVAQLRDSTSYIGELQVTIAELPDDAAEHDVTEVLKALWPNETKTRVTSWSNGVWLGDCIGVSENIVLAYKKSNETEAVRLFAGPITDVYLFLQKIGYQMQRRYFSSVSLDTPAIRPELYLHETALRTALRADLTKKDNLRGLEAALIGITSEFGKFAKPWGEYCRLRETVRINCNNLRNLLERESASREGLFGAWLRVAENALDQLTADGAYYDVLIQETNIVMQGLEGQASLKRVNAEERIAVQNDQRNTRIAVLSVVIGLVAAVLSVGSDDTVRALIRWTYKRGNSEVPADGEFLVWKLSIVLIVTALFAIGMFFPKLINWFKARRTGFQARPSP